MDYDEALKRNILPVPVTQYGSAVSGGAFNYWDDFQLNPPESAVSAEIKLMYQPTSWEYIEFLFLANNGSVSFLGNEGVNILDAWVNTDMAQPHAMESISWTPPDSDNDGIPDAQDNCPNTSNNDQLNNDNDAQGDACDIDDDNNGIPDSMEIGDPQAPTDTDADGTPDYHDFDNDNDGVDDLVEIGADPNNPLDVDDDGTPDYMDADTIAGTAGDINGDGEVNVVDLLLLQQAVIGQITLNASQIRQADLYPPAGDGTTNISDLVLLEALVLAP
jgi:hypothetical protein